jgi:hypothetical protein
MSIRSLRRLTAVGALALATTAAVAACTSAAAPVEVLPPGAGAALPGVATPAPTGSTDTEPVPAAPEPVAGASTNAPPTGRPCLGAVVHRVDAADTGPPWKRLCMTVGGVLRVANLGPEGFSVNSDRVACDYEAAVRDCRLLRAGTVTFTITNAHETRTLTLRIAKASSSSGSPACLAPGTTFTIDATDGGPPGRPVCMRTSGVVRVVNLGPEGLVVSPSGAVVCSYEAAVRECRFTGPRTVTFTTTHGDSMPRGQTVVAVR